MAATRKKRKKAPRRDLGYGFVLPAPLPEVECEDEEVARHVSVLAAGRPIPELRAARQRLFEDPRPSDGAHLLVYLTEELLDVGANPYRKEVFEGLPKAEQRKYDRASGRVSTAWNGRKRFLSGLFRALALHEVAEPRLVEVALGEGDRRVREMAASALLSSPRTPSKEALARLAGLVEAEYPPLVRLGAAAVFAEDPEGAVERLEPLFRHEDWLLASAAMRAIPAGHPDPRLRALVGELLASPDLGVRMAAVFAVARVGMGEDLVEPLLRAADLTVARSGSLPRELVQRLVEAADPRTLPVLVWALRRGEGDADPVLRGIGALGDPAALPAVEAFLEANPGRKVALAVREELAARPAADEEAVRRLEAAVEALGARAASDEPAEEAPLPDREPRRMPPVAEQREVLRAELGEALVGALELARAAVGLVAVRTEEEPRLGASRFGGDPDLPEGFPWPEHRGRALSFVAQLDLEELHEHDADGRLPEAGWLLFFVDPEFDEEEDYLSVCHVSHVPAGSRLARTRARGSRGPLCRLHPFTELQLPAPSHPSVKGMGPGYAERAGDNGAGGQHQLLGHRPEEWDTPEGLVPLLQLASDLHPGWCWGDEGHLVFLIPPEALAEGDFSRVRSQYGE